MDVNLVWILIFISRGKITRNVSTLHLIVKANVSFTLFVTLFFWLHVINLH